VLAREEVENPKSQIENLKLGKRLVAYVVPRRELAPTINELRSFLEEKLPQYMIPSAFVLLDALPLTPNGKVDRKALPVPDHNRPELEECYIAPRTPIEELLAEIWAAVLKLDKVGIHDNFFELGGHSLLATRVVSRIREAYRIELPLRSLFEAPTVAGLAYEVQKARESGVERSEPAITPVSRQLHQIKLPLRGSLADPKD
jgi:acyl carrier protein